MGWDTIAQGLSEGLQQVNQQQQQVQALHSAAGLFEAIGTPEAQQYGAALRKDPNTAADLAAAFGGPKGLYDAMRQSAYQKASLAATSANTGAVNSYRQSQLNIAQQTRDQANANAAETQRHNKATEAAAAAAAARKQDLTPTQAATIEGRANAENRGTAMKTFVPQQAAYQSVLGLREKYAQIKNAGGKQDADLGGLDSALLLAMARVDNPGAVARITTIEELRKVAGLPGRVSQALQDLQGTGRLSWQARNSLMNSADITFKKVLTHQKEYEQNIRDTVERQGANRYNLNTLVDPAVEQYFGSGDSGQPSAPELKSGERLIRNPKTGQTAVLGVDGSITPVGQ